MSEVELKNLISLQDLLNYCQSNERVCLQPLAWEVMFRKFRANKKYITNRYPPNHPVLGGWTDDNHYKRLLFLSHIYWAYKHDLFEWVDWYIRSREKDKWNIESSFWESGYEVEMQFDYVRLDAIKEEYNSWIKD